MAVIDEIRERLAQKHPDLSYSVDNGTIRVKASAPDGFDVWLQDAAGEFIVGYGDGWHEHFTSKDEALNCFGFGLSDQCRLKIIRRGRYEYKWIVEAMTDGEWVEDSTTGTLPLVFWLPRRVEYRQNRLQKGR